MLPRNTNTLWGNTLNDLPKYLAVVSVLGLSGIGYFVYLLNKLMNDEPCNGMPVAPCGQLHSEVETTRQSYNMGLIGIAGTIAGLFIITSLFAYETTIITLPQEEKNEEHPHQA